MYIFMCVYIYIYIYIYMCVGMCVIVCVYLRLLESMYLGIVIFVVKWRAGLGRVSDLFSQAFHIVIHGIVRAVRRQ